MVLMNILFVFIKGWYYRVNGKVGYWGCIFYKFVFFFLYEVKLVEICVFSENFFRDVR